ncbi:serine hydrolase domain-containing protein [Arthrobacter sp. B2a2-09]|uniref:serine hydrolase domain-containing protein n=1 Tax=Arthrobacter sp. B2a2-09 TaxID=2952822 RepID=UPI0022CD243D|nr:serine hydrolase domain-containing protein [Arthrobacter sp. B2a2-09]MCZ9880711.1 beta-lactamase family protein [Arthrobacter sp. B2a2-09]
MSRAPDQDATAARMDASLDYVRTWLQTQFDRRDIPGMQVAIRYCGTSRLSEAYGVTNRETRDPVTPRHLFRIASQSKTFTAVAVLQLVERDLLRLDDSIGSHLSELAESPVGDVTVRDLLNHTAGIVRDVPTAVLDQVVAPTPDENQVIQAVLEHGFVFPPNVSLKYSNVGYSLLGIIIGRVSGVGYDAYVGEYIVDVLGLKNTGPDLDLERVGEFVHGHAGPHARRPQAVLPLMTSRANAPCGGFYSTADDLADYYAAHLMGDKRLLSDGSKRLQQHAGWSSNPADPAAARYGLGMVRESFRGHTLLGHSGGHPAGQVSETVFDPDTGVIVSVLANGFGSPVGELARGVVSLLYAGAADPTDPAGFGLAPDVFPTQPVELSTDELARFTGRYVDQIDEFHLAALGGKLLGIHPDGLDPVGPAERYAVVSAGELRNVGASVFANAGETVTVVRNADDSVRRIQFGRSVMWPAERYEGPSL